MSVMSIAEAWPAAGRPFTAARLDRMPDDGRRYELLDGVLVVSPRPTVIHQVVAYRLAVRGSSYQQIAHAAGDEVFRAERPCLVDIVPTRLVAGLPRS